MLRSLLLVFVSWSLGFAAWSAETGRPNIIFILADDLGYGELGCFGSKLIATPHLDRMAAEGMKFTQFYAGSTVCAPSRSVLMTGLHTGHTRVRGNAGKQNRAPQNLRAEDRTLPELLKKAGYATALIGKWGIGHEGSDGVPNKKGFDYFYGYLDQTHAHNPYPPFIMRNGERVLLRNKTIPGTGGAGEEEGAGIAQEPLDYVPDLMAREALQWVEAQKGKPFFLYWSLISPHANNEGNRHRRGQELPDLGPYADQPWSAADKAHAASITRLDDQVGRLFALLQRLGIDRNTLVMFSSDNGPHKEGGNNPEFFDSNGPFTGYKRSLTDGGIRVPTLARWPARITPGAVVTGAYWFPDVLPSLVEIAHAEHGSTPRELDGRCDGNAELAAILMGAKLHGRSASRGDLYWEFHENGFSQAVLMDSRWKAIRLKRLDAPIALYDLDADVSETKNLAGEHPELVERARKLFVSARTDSPDWPIKEGR